MAAQQGFRAINNEPFVYQENNAGDSASLGIDSTGVYSVSVSATPGTSPSASSQIVITPGGDITLNPTIKVFVNSPLETASSITIDAGKLNLPTTSAVNGQITIGGSAVFHTFGTRNTFVGESSGNFTLASGLANANTGIGANTLTTLASGVGNTALGDFSLNQLTSGNYNTALGQDVLETLVSGDYNIAIGEGGGGFYAGGESSNILLNNLGVLGESNKLRIGAATGSGARQINAAYIAGMYNTAVGATAGVALVASDDQIGSISGIAGTVLAGGTKPSFVALSGITVTSITGTANQIVASAATGAVTLSLSSTLIAPGSIASTTSLTAGNLTTAGIVYNTTVSGLLTSHQTTNHNVQVGNATGQLTDIAPSATSGVPLVSQGAAADPVFGTAVVAGGGTGLATLTAYGLMAAGTTSTGNMQQVSGTGSLNQVLVSQGAGALPIWAPVPATAGVTSIAGTANQITASASTGAVTLSIPNTFIAPGSIASTTSLTAGNGFTVTTGTITLTPLSTSGMVVNSGAGVISTSATTNHAVQIGNSSGQLTSLAVGATGTVLTGATGADPSFTALSGIAVTSITGTANQITASASTGAVTLSTPSTFIAPGTIASTTTNAAGTNFILPTTTSTVGNILWGSSGSTGRIMFPHTTTNVDTNVFIGQAAGNYTLTGVNNIGIGYGPLNVVSSGVDNICLGNQAGVNMTSASHNIAIGQDAMGNGSVQTFCVALGQEALKGVGFPGGTAANYDIGIGYRAGFNYANSGESSNICINSAGTAGESNKLRIGSATGTGTQQLNGAFICGIYNTAVGATAGVVLADSSNQLGGLAGAAGTVLVGGTKPAFTTLSTLAVTSITGTANQITASASTGAVTLSTPSTFIAPGTIASTTTNAAGTNFILPVTSATAGQILQNSIPVFHTTGTNSTFVGSASGNLTTTTSASTAVGQNSLNALTSGTVDNAFGKDALKAATTSSNNSAFGNSSLEALTTGNGHNTAFGNQTMSGLGTGAYNAAFGFTAGNALTTTDSSNIMIMNDGVAGDNNTIRIGTNGTGNGQQNKCFVAAINGITVTGTTVLVSASDQLGIAVSSRRFKENIQNMDEYSSEILKLRPVTFNYLVGDDHSQQSGLIAEEVHEVMPSLVVLDKEGLPQTVKYHDLPALLLNELQKMNERMKVLELKQSLCGCGERTIHE